MLASESNSILTSKKKPNTPHSHRKDSPSPTTINDKKAKLIEMAEAVAHFGSWEYLVTEDRALWSPELFHIFGIKPSTKGLTMNEYRKCIHPDDLPKAEKLMLSFQKTAHLGENVLIDYRIIRPDGSIRTLHSQRQVKEITPDRKPLVIVGVEQDITEQRIAEQVSTENVKLLALAEQVAHFGSWEWNLDRPYAIWSPELFRIFGLQPRPSGLTMEEYQSFIHPDDAADITRRMQLSRSKPKINQKTEVDYRIIRPDGSIRTIHSQRIVRELTKEGKFKVIVGVDQDVTEQRQALEDLKKSEERFRIVAEAARVMVYEVNLATRKIQFIHGAEQLGGYHADEFPHTLEWVISHIHPDDIPHVNETWEKAIHNPKLDRYVLEYRFLHKKGSYITVKDTARTVKDSTGKPFLIIGGIRDITARRRDQEKIRQYSKHLEQLVAERTKQLIDYERLAAMGQIASMVGHDIRNPLQALIGEVFLIKSDLGSISDQQVKTDLAQSLNSIEQNIYYINKIVADLQDYSRQLNPDFTLIDLEDLFVEVFEALTLPETIKLSFRIKSVKKIRCDPTYIRRILTNLVNNAVQAMPKGGKLEIATYPENNHVCITIADTGVGIDDAVKQKIFTPTFTTKAKGQGLGLAVVKRLVEAQGGIIRFDSVVGKGTTFYIKLPIQPT